MLESADFRQRINKARQIYGNVGDVSIDVYYSSQAQIYANKLDTDQKAGKAVWERYLPFESVI